MKEEAKEMEVITILDKNHKPTFMEQQIMNDLLWNTASAMKSNAKGFSERLGDLLASIKIDCPDVISDEFEIIMRESMCVIKECYVAAPLKLDCLPKYLETQKKHLDSIASKIGQNSTYEKISTNIVKITLFAIEEAEHVKEIMSVKQFKGYPMYFFSNYYSDIWKSVEILQTYKMSYKYKYEIFNKTIIEIKRKCECAFVDTRTVKEKKREIFSEILSNNAGCLLIIVIFIILCLIGVIN